MSNKPVIGIVQVKECLDKGMSREEIAEFFAISNADCKRLFTDPRLKGLKAKKVPGFVLVEDATEIPETKEVVEEIEAVKEVPDSPALPSAQEVLEEEKAETPKVEETADWG